MCARETPGRAPPGRNQPLFWRSKIDVYSQTKSTGPVRTPVFELRVVLFQWFTLSRQRFIDRPLPVRDFMPFARHLAITRLDLRIGHYRGSTLALIRLLPTDIGPASHDAFSRSVLTEEYENVIG